MGGSTLCSGAVGAGGLELGLLELFVLQQEAEMDLGIC